MSGRAWAATAIAAVAFGAGCGGAGRDKILRVLFDDPPGRDAAGAAAPAAEDASPAAPPDAEADAGASADRPAAPRVAIVRHAPYDSGDCGDCHALSGSATFVGRAAPAGGAKFADHSGARLRFPKDRICFGCHDDMTPEALAARAKVLHAPAEGAECLECHDPHQARWPALLRDGDPFENLCFRCHDGDDVLRTDTHAALAADARVCTNCHDPHGSNREYLLKS